MDSGTTHGDASIRRSTRSQASITPAERVVVSRKGTQMDIRDLFNQPTWGDDIEPAPKRQKVTSKTENATLVVTLKLPKQPLARASTLKLKSIRKPKVLRGPANDSDNRPLPWGHPQVWSDTRAELADALPYFSAYQGAASVSAGRVKGMVLDEDRGVRSFMGEEVIITRAGGGVGNDEVTGKAIQKKDQNIKNFRVSSFQHNMVKKIPIQVIVGSKNLQCPSKIPFRYCVMGGFHITYMWAEKANKFTVYKFRLEKLDLQRKSWWAPEDSTVLQESRVISDVRALEKKCEDCQETWKQIYKQGWMCLNADCKEFWNLHGKYPSDTDLEFSEDFLTERTPCPELEVPYSLIPKLPKYDTGTRQEKTLSVTKQCWKGIVCEKCGRCNQRRDWDSWKCQALGCDFEYAPPREIIPASAVMGDLNFAYEGHALSDDKWDDQLVLCEAKIHGFFKVHDYRLGHDDIRITHLHSNGPINGQKGGADDIFKGLQEANMGLQRLPLQAGAVSGLVSAHFSKNFGLPYEYVLKHPELSTSFQDGPAEIREAIRRLLWAGKRAIPTDEKLVINECLAVGYFQGQSMGYHDDGETCLGPHVVAWSLGCPATMKIRMKWKYYTGFNKEKKVYHSNFPMLPGCFKPGERKKLNALAGTMSVEDLSAKARKVLGDCPRYAPPILEMKLRHGDFMSMHGALMQLYYEHEVVSNNELRFALTGRYVKPEMVSKDQWSKGDIDLDPNNPYDGDIQVYEDWKQEQEIVKDRASMRRHSDSSASTLV